MPQASGPSLDCFQGLSGAGNTVLRQVVFGITNWALLTPTPPVHLLPLGLNFCQQPQLQAVIMQRDSEVGA